MMRGVAQREVGQGLRPSDQGDPPAVHVQLAVPRRRSRARPAGGGAIMCPNHTSVLDSFFLPLVLPRRITYVGKAEYMDNWKTKYLFPALGMIPIDRAGGNASGACARRRRSGILEAGELFGIYPEGTRSRDGQLHKGHTGPPGSRCAPARRSSPSASGAPARSSRPTPRCPSRSGRCDPRSGDPSTSTATASAPTTAWCCARSPTRSCTRSASSPARSTSTSTPTKKAERLPTETAQIRHRPSRSASRSMAASPRPTAADDGHTGDADDVTAPARRPSVLRRPPLAGSHSGGRRPDRVPGSGRRVAGGARYARPPCPTDHDHAARRFDATRRRRAPPRAAWRRRSAPGWPRRR